MVGLHSMPVEKDIARHLEKDKWYKEYPKSSIISILGHVKVFFKTIQLRIGNVDSIKKGSKVEPTEYWDQAKIAFSGNTAVKRRVAKCLY